MFGISFGELLLIGLIALLVLGPERLPGAARTAGLWIGRLKRSFNAIKTEVEREIGADEIRRQLHNEHIMALEKQIKESIVPPTVGSLLSDSAPEGNTPASSAPASPAPATAAATPVTAPPATPNEPDQDALAKPSTPVASEAATSATPQDPIEPQQPSRIP
ncbi:Sec-independent protein translocase protein TatB [compost metagenome]